MPNIPLYDARFNLQVNAPLSRRDGKSAAAKVAYNTASSLKCGDTGKQFNYTKKHCVSTDIYAPEGAPVWINDLQELVRRVEQSEKRKDARLLREVLITLPREIPHAIRPYVVKDIVQKYVEKGAVAICSYHNPKAADGGDNPHCHVLLTLRALDESTESGFAKTRNHDLDNVFGGRARGKNEKSSEAITKERVRACEIANSFLRAAGSNLRANPYSHEKRGFDSSLVEPKITEESMAQYKKYGGKGNAKIIEIAGLRKLKYEIKRNSEKELEAMNTHKQMITDESPEVVEKIVKAKKKGKGKLAFTPEKQHRKMEFIRGIFPDVPANQLAEGSYLFNNVYQVNFDKGEKKTTIAMWDDSYIYYEAGDVFGYTHSPHSNAGKAAAILAAAMKTGTIFLEPQNATVQGAGNPGSKPRSPAAIAEDALPEEKRLSLLEWWQEQGYHDVLATPQGILINLSKRTKLYDKGNELTVNGEPTDEALRALTHKAKEHWGGRIELFGSEKFKAKAWLQCMRDGIEVVGYEPSPKLLKEWEREQSKKKMVNGLRKAGNSLVQEAKALQKALQTRKPQDAALVDDEVKAYLSTIKTDEAALDKIGASSVSDLALEMPAMKWVGWAVINPDNAIFEMQEYQKNPTQYQEPAHPEIARRLREGEDVYELAEEYSIGGDVHVELEERKPARDFSAPGRHP